MTSKTLPIEPTLEMLAAGRNTSMTLTHLEGRRIYRAMYDAAPAQPAAAEAVAWKYQEPQLLPFLTFDRLSDDYIRDMGYTETPLYLAAPAQPAPEPAADAGEAEKELLAAAKEALTLCFKNGSPTLPRLWDAVAAIESIDRRAE
jgi:hypothetical protein